MCQGSKSKHLIMEGEKFQQKQIETLLELAAADDVSGFESKVETNGTRLDDVGLWYGTKNGCKGKMGFEKRTPLMIASVYGSTNVVKYIISSGKADVNKVSDSDGATALHCAAAGGSSSSIETVKLLLAAFADRNLTDANGNKPVDLIARGVKAPKRKGLEMLLNGFSIDETETEETEIVTAKKEYPVDVSLPDINEGVYSTDEFRMYTFKVKPCSRAYSHDWTECPFVHPGENARRRDPRKHQYTCVPCPEFRKGSCVKGDSCEYAHGVFESWLHPAQYRTRLCKDETGCARKVCFFAHRVEELRPLYASTGSAVPSPKAGSVGSIEVGSMSPPMSPVNLWQNKFVHVTPPALQLPGSRLKTSLNARDLEVEIELLQRQQMIDDLSNNILGSPKQIRRNSNQTRTSFGFDPSSAVAQAVMKSRLGSFAKQRSQSFVDRGAARSTGQSSTYSEWGSPDGKLDWGFSSEEANKLRKSASFGFRGPNLGSPVKANHEPDDSWAGFGFEMDQLIA